MRELIDILGPTFQIVYVRLSLNCSIHNVGQQGFAAHLQCGCCIKEAEDEMPTMPV